MQKYDFLQFAFYDTGRIINRISPCMIGNLVVPEVESPNCYDETDFAL